MISISRLLSSLAILSLFPALSNAQNFDEWEARPNVSLKYKLNKRLAIAGTYYLYLDKNLTRYNKSVISGEATFKAASWLKLGLDYRYGIDGKDNYHDLRYSLTFNYKPIKRLTIGYRPLLQRESTSFGKAHPENNPVTYYFRNRVTVGYEIIPELELYVFTETYLDANHGAYSFYRQKSAVGADFSLSGRSKLGGRFEVLRKLSGKTVARPNISYTYTIGYIKKKPKID